MGQKRLLTVPNRALVVAAIDLQDRTGGKTGRVRIGIIAKEQSKTYRPREQQKNEWLQRV